MYTNKTFTTNLILYNIVDINYPMTFKVVKQISPIGAMKTFTKPNCNICMEEHLTILKTLRDKRVTIMNMTSEIYGACRHKIFLHTFCLSTDDSVLTGERVRPLNGFQIL